MDPDIVFFIDTALSSPILVFFKHFSGLSIYLSVEAYKDWQNNPTITTLNNANYPIGKIEYPAGGVDSENLTRMI